MLRPRVGQKEPARLGNTICYSQEWARKSHQDSAVRFVTAKSLARKSHKDSEVRFVTAKNCPERATETRQYDLLRQRVRQYDLLRPRVGQKEPPRLGSTICYGQTWARKSHRDSAVRFVTAKSWPERATKTRQYDLISAKRGTERATKTRRYNLLRLRVVQKESPRLGSTICYGQTWARNSHQDSAVRFVTAKSWPEKATKTRQYDLLRTNMGQKKPPRLGSSICYGIELSRKSHRNSSVRFVTAKRGPERATKTRQYDLLRHRTICSWLRVGQKKPLRLGSTICSGQTWARKRATKTRQYDLLRTRVGHKEPLRLGSIVTAKRGQKEPPRLGSTLCYAHELGRKKYETRQYNLLRSNVGQKEPPRIGSTICYGQTWARKSQRDSAVRFVTAKSWPERVIKTRQYDLLRPNVGQKEPPRFDNTICYGQEFGQKESPRLGCTICYGQELSRKSHQDSAIRFVTAKNWPERATRTRQYDLLRSRVVQKERYGQDLARKSHQDSAVRFVTAKSWPEKATKTRQYDWFQERPPRLGSTICYGQELTRKSHQDSAVRFVMAKRGPDHQDSAVRFVTAKRGPNRATETRQYDLLRPRIGQKEPPRLGNTICYGQELARTSRQDAAVRLVTARDSAVRFVTAKNLARKSHQDSAVRFVTAKSWP